MANKNLFSSYFGRLLERASTRNEAGGAAYERTAREALAQFAATGCLNGTFYATDADHLKATLEMACDVPVEFLAKTAIFARERGHMKDMPALLVAVLTVRAPELLPIVFPRVVDNGRMLRNYVQIVRSGVVGRKSFGTRPKRLIREWLDARSDRRILAASMGSDPSLADIVKMVHPKPKTATRSALYGRLIGKDVEVSALPEELQAFEAFKADPASAPIPDVPFSMLTSLPIGRRGWARIAETATWQTTRMNLNTFARHGVFEVDGMTEKIAKRLGDERQVRRARVFPYQLLMAYKAAGEGVPPVVRDALQTAMEHALHNVPGLPGRVVVCPDVSGSMRCAATGYRKGSTSKVRCVDVAGLFAAAILRNNPRATVLPFEHRVVDVRLNARDSVMTNAEKLASVGGGGTSCSAPLAELNRRKAKVDTVVFVSDNESWVDARSGATATMDQWRKLKARNPKARLVCVDIQPHRTVQATEATDILNVGGFSDAVFDVVAAFTNGTGGPERHVAAIEAVELAPASAA